MSDLLARLLALVPQPTAASPLANSLRPRRDVLSTGDPLEDMRANLPLEPARYGAVATNPQPGTVAGVRPWFSANPNEVLVTPDRNERDRRFADMALNFAGTTPVRGGIRAFHGSPHNFNRFDMRRIGTGEGAQAYGHGLYFAENESVARAYRDALSPRAAPRFNSSRPDWMSVESYQQAVADLQNFGAQNGKMPQIGDVDGPARALLAGGHVTNWRTSRPTGRMYEVNLNVDPNRLLDWDAPLSAQAPPVRAAARELDQAARLSDYQRRGFDQATIAEYLNNANARDLTGEQVMRGIMNNGQDAAAASNRLRDAGIPGIRYLDQGSRGAGEGTRNFVMFDDSLIEILRKYGLAGLGIGLGAANVPFTGAEQ